MSNNTQCVDIPLINDTILESEEVFLLESVSTAQVTAIPPTVNITIQDDDSERLQTLGLMLTISCILISNISYSSTAVLVSFTDKNYDVVEPGTVEVGIELIGSLSFPIDITVEVTSAAAMCKSNNSYFTLTSIDNYIHLLLALVELDYVGVPANVTFTEASVQSLAVSIVDDNLVERTEAIQLLLTTMIPGVILADPNSTLIEIIDSDCKFIYCMSYIRPISIRKLLLPLTNQ